MTEVGGRNDMIFGHYCWPLTRLVILLAITPPAITVISRRLLHLGKGWTLALIAVVMVAIVVVQILVDRRRTRRECDAGKRDSMSKQ